MILFLHGKWSVHLKEGIDAEATKERMQTMKEPKRDTAASPKLLETKHCA